MLCDSPNRSAPSHQTNHTVSSFDGCAAHLVRSHSNARRRVSSKTARSGDVLAPRYKCVDQLLKPGQASGKAIGEKLAALQESDVLLCSVVKAELWHGAEKYGNREARLAKLAEIFARYLSLPFDDAAARHYATVRHDLETRGEVIGPNDLKIAAICLARGLTLVSSNHEFSRVAGLKVEDWAKSSA